MEKVELSPLEWCAKVNESLTLAFRDIHNEITPQEKHIEVMKSLMSVYNNGDLMLYKDKSRAKEEILSQGTLFDKPQNQESPKGTQIDNKGLTDDV